MTFQELLDLCDEDPFRVQPDRVDTVKSAYVNGYLPWFSKFRTGDKDLEKNLNGMVENGLTEEEAFFILAYSSSCSRWINRDLRNGIRLQTRCKQAFAESLDNALTKMKSFSGIVYRMDSPADSFREVLEWFKINKSKKFSIPYFLSTAQEDYENSEVVWQIETLSLNSKGKDISRLCQAPLELEVLFERNSKFQIVDVRDESKYIYLKELDGLAEVDFELVGVYHRNLI